MRKSILVILIILSSCLQSKEKENYVKVSNKKLAFYDSNELKMKYPIKINWNKETSFKNGEDSQLFMNFTHKNIFTDVKCYLNCKYFIDRGKVNCRNIKFGEYNGDCVFEMSESYILNTGYGFDLRNNRRDMKIPFVIEGKYQGKLVIISFVLVVQIINEEKYNFKIEDYHQYYNPILNNNNI